MSFKKMFNSLMFGVSRALLLVAPLAFTAAVGGLPAVIGAAAGLAVSAVILLANEMNPTGDRRSPFRTIAGAIIPFALGAGAGGAIGVVLSAGLAAGGAAIGAAALVGVTAAGIGGLLSSAVHMGINKLCPVPALGGENDDMQEMGSRVGGLIAGCLLVLGAVQYKDDIKRLPVIRQTLEIKKNNPPKFSAMLKEFNNSSSHMAVVDTPKNATPYAKPSV